MEGVTPLEASISASSAADEDLIWYAEGPYAWTFHLLEQALSKFAGHLLVGGPNRVLHIGAHQGEELTYYLGIFDEIALVEPDPANTEVIEDRVRVTSSHSRVQIIQAAAVSGEGDRDWTGDRLIFNRYDFTPMSGTMERPDRTLVDQFAVQARPIQSLIRRYMPDLLVIDTQGTELELARAAARHCAEPDPVTGYTGPAMMIVEAYTPQRNARGKMRPKVKCAAELGELDAALGEYGWRRVVRWVYDTSLYTDACYVRGA